MNNDRLVLMETILDNTKRINELLEWKDQMYEIIDGISNSIEGLTSIVTMLDEEIQSLTAEDSEENG